MSSQPACPPSAARDFVLGHLRIQIAVLFGEVNGTFSDAAYKISKRAKPVLFKEGWQKIFEMRTFANRCGISRANT